MRYALNMNKVFSDVTDGIAILIDMETGLYYGMNLLTTNIYENIIGGADTEELLSALSAVKGYDGEIAERFAAFVSELVERSFITEAPSAAGKVCLSFDEYPGEELDLVLSVFPDASELLLADPIHQVKEEVGWMPEKDALK